MRWTFFLVATFAGSILAQPKGPPLPPLVDCGTHGDAEVICGARGPEDLELTPDGKFLIVSQFGTPQPGARAIGAGLMLFDPAKKSFTPMAISAEPLKDWGDPSCPGPPGDRISPHGISLSKRANGKVQLQVVNHGGRESMEMFEVKRAGSGWALAWHGCVPAMQPYNDVAAMPDGGYFATHPTALTTPGVQFDLFSGQPSGFVVRWSPGKSELEIPGTRAGYPNGVVATDDGRFMYFNAWTAREVHKYDVKAGKEAGVVKLDFMPDNLSWTKKGQMLAAGVKGARGDCPAGSGHPCIQGFGVALIDPATMKATTVFDSEGKGALISGVSVALQAGGDIYVGAFQGDRLVKFAWKESR
jgi:hypothetical protein